MKYRIKIYENAYSELFYVPQYKEWLMWSPFIELVDHKPRRVEFKTRTDARYFLEEQVRDAMKEQRRQIRILDVEVHGADVVINKANI